MLLNKVTDSHAVSVLIMLRPYTKPGCAAHVHQHGLLQIAEVKALTRQRSVRCCSNATADPEVAERVVLREWNTRLHQQCLQWQQDHVVAETEWLTSALQLSSHVARKQCTQGAALQVLMPWVTRPQDIKAVQQAGHKVVAVQPAWQLVDQLVTVLELQPPLARAHDGWERYTSPGVLLYRGSPYSLTPPVLSLAGEVQLVLDRWGLFTTPPSLLQRYLATIASLLPKGAVYAAAAQAGTAAQSQDAPGPVTPGHATDVVQPGWEQLMELPGVASGIDVGEVKRQAAVAGLGLQQVRSDLSASNGCQLLVLCKQKHY